MSRRGLARVWSTDQHALRPKNDEPEVYRLRAVDVLITIAGRSLVTCIFPRERSAQSSVDNCHADKAVTNAKQLADLLSRNDLVGS